MSRQREQARAAGKFKAAGGLSYQGVDTRFEGYEQLQGQGNITAIYVDGTSVDRIDAGAEAIIVLDATPFYAESGGKVGDAGVLGSGDERCEVSDTEESPAKVV